MFRSSAANELDLLMRLYRADLHEQKRLNSSDVVNIESEFFHKIKNYLKNQTSYDFLSELNEDGFSIFYQIIFHAKHRRNISLQEKMFLALFNILKEATSARNFIRAITTNSRANTVLITIASFGIPGTLDLYLSNIAEGLSNNILSKEDYDLLFAKNCGNYDVIATVIKNQSNVVSLLSILFKHLEKMSHSSWDMLSVIKNKIYPRLLLQKNNTVQDILSFSLKHIGKNNLEHISTLMCLLKQGKRCYVDEIFSKEQYLEFLTGTQRYSIFLQLLYLGNNDLIRTYLTEFITLVFVSCSYTDFIQSFLRPVFSLQLLKKEHKDIIESVIVETKKTALPLLNRQLFFSSKQNNSHFNSDSTSLEVKSAPSNIFELRNGEIDTLTFLGL